jgi:hypothetical protein
MRCEGKMARCHTVQGRAGIVIFRSEMKQNSVTQLLPADATVHQLPSPPLSSPLRRVTCTFLSSAS